MTKNMTTLGEVSDRVDALNKNCHDKLIDVPEISFDSLQTMRIGDECHTMRTMAQRSIAWRLGIPYNYLAKCPPELQTEQMNFWIRHEKREQLFIRFDGEDVRAIFTPRYKPVDNFEVLARLDEMGYTPDTQVQCHHDSEFMLLSIPDGKRSFKINGDKMTPGISISNSEVGLAALGVAFWLYRLICSNGMVAKTEVSSLAYRHVSTKVLEVLDELSPPAGPPECFRRHPAGMPRGRMPNSSRYSTVSCSPPDLPASEPDQGRMAGLARRQSEKVADHNVSHQHGIIPFA